MAKAVDGRRVNVSITVGLQRIFANRNDATALARARAWWGAEVTSMFDGSSASAQLTGLMAFSV